MTPSTLFNKKIDTKNLVTISVKTDICDILVKKSAIHQVRFHVLYYPINDIIDFYGELESLGTLNVNKDTQNISFTLNKRDISDLFISNVIPKTEIIIEVPENSKLNIETLKNNIRIFNISIEFFVSTISGDVTIQKAGHGTIINNKGFVRLIDVFDNFDITSETGNIHLKKGTGGVLNATTKNGDIYIKEMLYHKICCKSIKGGLFLEMGEGSYGFVELFSEIGDIKLKVDHNNFTSILLNSKNGDTKISMPPDNLVNLDITTENGVIDAEFEHENADEVILDSDKMYISFGEDLPNIRVDSLNGNIIIKDINDTLNNVIDIEPQIVEPVAELTEEIIIEAETVDDDVKVYTIKFLISSFFRYIISYCSKAYKFICNKLKSKNKLNNQAILKVLELLEKNQITLEEAEKLIAIIKQK